MLSSQLRPLLRKPLQSPVGLAGRMTLVHKAIGILRKYGTNAHVYLPGASGVSVSGLPTSNFLLSDGSTGYSSTDGVVGLVLDAMGTVGAELVANGGFDTDTVWDKGASWSIAGGVAVCTGAANYLAQSFFPAADPVGTTYAVTVDAVAVSGTVYVGGGQYSYVPLALGTRTYYLTRSGLSNNNFLIGGGGGTCTLSSVSAKKIPGIHATQATTANKPILRQSAGKYSWQFDGVNDRLSLSAPLFQMSDDHCVIAGFSTTTTASGTIAAPSTTAGVSNGLVCRLAIGSGNVYAEWSDSVGISSQLNSSAINVNTPYVAAARKVSNARILRMNGIQAATDSTVLGSTTSNTGTIGAINVVSVADYFSGSIYPVIAIKGTVSDADLLTLERFVGQLSGVSI